MKTNYEACICARKQTGAIVKLKMSIYSFPTRFINILILHHRNYAHIMLMFPLKKMIFKTKVVQAS